MEKQRYTALANGQPSSKPLEIHIATDKQNRVLTIQDTGIGMTQEELISNLGTIARSGSKVNFPPFNNCVRVHWEISLRNEGEGLTPSLGDEAGLSGDFGIVRCD